jgi:catechol 2,3-dioxygenase-like lactoylglutathione lyase family enzyme
MVGKLDLVMIIVSDMERSVAFYRDVLGLQVEYESPAWSQVRAGDVSIGLHSTNGGDAPSPGSVVMSFSVDSTEGAVEELRSRGAEIAEEPKREEFGGYLAVVHDPDGYSIQLLEGWPPTGG